MTALFLSWKEVILFASLIIFLFIPWSRGVRSYLLLGLFIYLLNKPLVANFHPGNIAWWLKDPAAWITVATWAGAVIISFRWLKGMKSKGVGDALFKLWWQPHLIALSLIILALFFFNLSKISPQFKTQADFSFPLLIFNVSFQYFIGLYSVKSSGESLRHPLPLVLIGVLVSILLVSFVYIPRTISEYRALLTIAPSHQGAVELIGKWEALLERNTVPSFGSIRAAAYGRIGDLKLSVGDFDGAQQGYQKALREDFDNVTAHIGLARLLVRERQTVEAREAFRRALRRSPSLSWNKLANTFPPLIVYEISLIAQALEAESRQEEALHAYRQVLAMNPQHAWANFRLGKMYFDQGEYEEAAAALQKTLAKVPRHLYALSYLADIYEKQGKSPLAQKYRDIIVKEVVTHRILPSDWKGRTGGNLYVKAGCHARITLYKGRVRFEIQARGTPAHGVWPRMVVKLDEEIIGETDETSKSWQPYSFTTDVQTGKYAFWVYFSNAFSLKKKIDRKRVREDRNLFVGEGNITYVR